MSPQGDDSYHVNQFLHDVEARIEGQSNAFFIPFEPQFVATPPCPDPLHVLVNRQGQERGVWSVFPADASLVDVKALALEMLGLIEDSEVRYRLKGIRVKAGPPTGFIFHPHTGQAVPTFEQEMVELDQGAQLRAAYALVGAPGPDGMPRHALPARDPHPEGTHLWLILIRDRLLRMRLDAGEVVDDPARLIIERMRIEHKLNSAH